MIGIEPRSVARQGMLCLSTPVGDEEVDQAPAAICRAVLAERQLPARAARELVAKAR